MYTGKKAAEPGKITETSAPPSPPKMGALSKEEAEGFFSNLVESPPVPATAKTEGHRKQSRESPASAVAAAAELVGGAFEQVSKNMNWGEGVERIIKENFIVGNLASAVDCCLKCGRSVPVFCCYRAIRVEN